MDITTETRDKGVYVIRSVGTQTWAADSTEAHGVRLELMDGLQPLAVCKLEVPGTLAAEERGTAEADAIDPWTRTLRYLAAVKRLRSHLDSARRLLDEAEDAEEYGRPVDEVDASALRAMATPAERGQADPGDDYDLAPLARLIVARLERQIEDGLRKALAFAPDPTEAPIHPAWELPGLGGMPGGSLAQAVARDLLASWASVRDLRDPLITWAVRDAEVTRTEVQQTTGVSRSTINRLLPAD
ncbi:hypothetical protein GCM10010293_40300 [Streptomyces griseoflavus]|uniref:hypothetical protein n=1 Tax=Streptomyces griseoflavus TaxID=35619 RepID=UPI00167E5AB9|nr:hypothetical protein [Streptomyces griseoflavus]GGV36817.1 hypothetical protein GCM10010293_40300 [Streptomyces griseoflavus]